MLNDDAIAEVMKAMQEAEREAIVKWLRASASDSSHPVNGAALTWAADMIEAGRHHDVE